MDGNPNARGVTDTGMSIEYEVTVRERYTYTLLDSDGDVVAKYRGENIIQAQNYFDRRGHFYNWSGKPIAGLTITRRGKPTLNVYTGA